MPQRSGANDVNPISLRTFRTWSDRHIRLGLTIAMVWFVAESRGVADDRLLGAMPDDAAIGVLIERPRQDFPTRLIEPILHAAMPSRSVAVAIVKAVEKLTAPTLVCFNTPMLTGEKADFVVMLDLRNRAFDVDEFVEKHVVDVIESVWKSEGSSSNKLTINKSTEVRKATVDSGKQTLFTYSVKDKRALFSTNAIDVLHWRSGTWPKRAWGERGDVKSLLAKLSPDAAITVVVNPEPLIRLIPKPKPNSGEDLALRILAPTDVNAVAAELGWDKRGIRLRLLAALADPCHGMLGALSGSGGSSSTFGILPEDFFAVGRVGFNSGASIIDGLYRITDSFDPGISEEYRTEISEFENDTKVNFTTDVLGGLSGEAVFGVRVDFLKKPPIAWTVVCPLSDAERFKDSLAKLEKHFNLKAATVPVGELPVRFVQDGGPIAWAIHDKRLIVAESPITIGEIAATKPSTITGEPRRDALRDCRKALGGFEQVCVMADIEQFFVKAPLGAVFLGASGTKLLRGTSAGLSFSTRDRIAELQARWIKTARLDKKEAPARETTGEAGSNEDDFDIEPLVGLLVEATGNARSEAQRTVVMSNMRFIGQGMYIWAQSHKDQFPATLEELVSGGMVTLDQFANPRDGTGPKSAEDVTRDGNVIYRPGLSTASDPREILLAEKNPQDGGASFLFVDGHVEFIPEPRATELIEQIKSGAAEIRR